MRSQRSSFRPLAVAAVLALAGVAAAPPTTDLVLRLQPVDGLRVDESIEPARALAWTDGQWRPVPSAAAARGEDFDLELPAGCAAGTTLVVEAWGGVSAPLAVAPEICGGERPIPVEVRPATDLGGRFEPPRGFALPAVAELWRAPCPASALAPASGPPGAVYPLSIDRRGRWRARLPAGCGRLALAPDRGARSGFAPAALDLSGLVPGSCMDAGSTTFPVGAGLVVRVTAADGRPVPGARAEAVAWDDLAEAVAASVAGRRLAAVPASRTGPGGVAELDGLGSGRWVIRVLGRRPGEASWSDPVTLAPGDRTEVELTLPAPAALRVELDPGGAPLPEGARLTVSATPSVFGRLWLEARLDRKIAPEEAALFSPIPPGRWQIAVGLALPEGPAGDVGGTEVEVPGGEETDLPVEVEGRLFRGTVSLRGQPVPGFLVFTPVFRITRPLSPPSARADAEGRFAVVVPRPGRYAVFVHERGTGRTWRLPPVALDDPAEPADLRLPTARIEGMVVDVEGHPVAGAEIEATRLAPPSGGAGREGRAIARFRAGSATSDGNGGFVVDGLTEGRWQLQARLGELVSPRAFAALGEDRTASGLVLRLAAHRRVRGRVVTAAGRPVAGALGLAMPLDSAVGLNPALTFTTSTDGSFELRLDHQVDGPVDLAVLAPGLPAAVFRRELRSGMVLSVPPEGGRLELRPAGGSWRESLLTGLALVDRQGALLPVVALLGRQGSLLDGSGAALDLGPVTAGPWSLVRLGDPAALARLLAAGAAALPPLARFDVPAGGGVVVTVPPPDGR